MYKVYKLYALVDKNNPSDIRYIGQTRSTLGYRLSQHKMEKVLNHKNNWINKIGKDNVIISLMEDNISIEEINNKERQLIKECKELGYRLTNITNGGEGWKGMKLSDKHKKNVSKNHADVSGKNNPMYGKNHTKESIEKIKKEKRIWFDEIGFNERQIEKMRERSKGEGNNKALLTNDKVLEIRKLSNDGIENYILAKMFNMKVPAIWKIINRYTWKHI